MKLIIFLITLLGVTTSAEAASTPNFTKSKKILQTRIFTEEYRVDYYCGCDYNEYGRMDWKSCGYRPRVNPTRGARLEWEHVVPAYYFGKDLACYKNGGRANCEKTSPDFNRREGDLHNLRPTVGELNADRSNKLYGYPKSARQTGEDGSDSKRIDRPIGSFYGECDFFTNTAIALPPRGVRGDLARITLYMNKKYNLVLPYSYLKLMNEWSKEDPVDDKERELNNRIKRIQGDSNPYVEPGVGR